MGTVPKPPEACSIRPPVPSSVQYSAEAGITSLHAFACNRKSRVVSTAAVELDRRCGPAKHTRHLKALVKITRLASQDTFSCTASLANIGCAPTASSQRAVPMLGAELDRAGGSLSGLVEGSWAPHSQSGKAQLLEQAFARAKQAATPLHDSADHPSSRYRCSAASKTPNCTVAEFV